MSSSFDFLNFIIAKNATAASTTAAIITIIVKAELPPSSLFAVVEGVTDAVGAASDVVTGLIAEDEVPALADAVSVSALVSVTADVSISEDDALTALLSVPDASEVSVAFAAVSVVFAVVGFAVALVTGAAFSVVVETTSFVIEMITEAGFP